MKLNPSANKNIFLLVCLCLAVLTAVAVITVRDDREAHKSYYEQYEEANSLFEIRRFDEPYEVYKRLSSVYKNSYILELKMAVCAMNLDMWPEAVGHSRRVIELYPLFAKDEDFMDALVYCLKEMGETETASRIIDYQYNFTRTQEQ